MSRSANSALAHLVFGSQPYPHNPILTTLSSQPYPHNHIVTTLSSQLLSSSSWSLQVLGNGFNLVTVGKQQLVRSVPGELNTDTNKVLEFLDALEEHEDVQRVYSNADFDEAALEALLS